jgi:hypothetical protein
VIAQWYSAGLRAGRSGGSSPGRGWEFFSSPPRPGLFWGPPASYTVGTSGSFPAVKRPGREANHSLPPTAEVSTWSYTSTPPIHLHGVVLS